MARDKKCCFPQFVDMPGCTHRYGGGPRDRRAQLWLIFGGTTRTLPDTLP